MGLRDRKIIGIILGMVFGALACLNQAKATEPSSPILQLNQCNLELLGPYQNAGTQIEIEVQNLVQDAANVLFLGSRAYYSKTGTKTQFELTVQDFRYEFGDGAHPQIHLAAGLKTDLLKLFKQADLNQMGQDAENILADMVGNLTQDYGPAAQAKISVLERSYDALGNLQLLRFAIEGKMDFSKLPEKIKVSSVLLSTVELQMSVRLNQVDLEAQGQVNPLYQGLAPDGAGLKEGLVKYIQHDTGIWNQLNDWIKQVDGFASSLVKKAII